MTEFGIAAMMCGNIGINSCKILEIIMEMIMGFLTKKNIGYIAAAVAILVVFLYWNGRNKTLDELTTNNINLQTEIKIKETQYKENLSKLKREISEQNEKISKMGRDHEILSTKLSQKLAEADVINEKLNNDLTEKVAFIDNLGYETCNEGIEMMVDLAISHKWYLGR
jgi:NAD-specific glutamate dehydrogenase